MKLLSRSLSSSPPLGASDAAAPVMEEPEEEEEAATGAAATGLGLDEIPMLPVSESNNPPTDGEAATTTSGSAVSPETMSPNE